jgi:protein-S-isoprenylcysteine O-methyltransferase Ste14
MASAAPLARAWIGTIVFLFLAPGAVAGLVPWVISGWRWYDWGGAAWAVVLFGNWGVLLYAAIVLAVVVAFVKGYEEPTLTDTYGEQYLEYRRNVRRWWPRLTPWRA